MPSYPLDAQAIMDAAIAQSGLTGYADEGLRYRFNRMIGLMNDFGHIPAAQYPISVQQVTETVIKRLQLERDWAQTPQILEGEIKQPFFVLGNPRAGTTLIQSLLTLDEGHRTPIYSEVQHPSPPPGVDPAHDAWARAEQEEYVRYILETSPRMLQAHPYFDQGALTEAEDEYLSSLDFHIVYPLWFLKVPNICFATPPEDPVLAFQFQKKFLQQLQWKMPAKRWVGKGVMHQYLAPALLEVFPDMVGFWIHRAPEDYIASLMDHMDIQYKPFNGELYNFQHSAMLEQLKAGVDAIMDCPATSDPRLHHIRFQDLVNDPVAVIAPIYEKCGIPFTKSYENALRQRLADPAHRANRYGKHHYSLEKFGYSKEQMRRMFSDYCDRFGL